MSTKAIQTNDREQLEKAFEVLRSKGYYARSRYRCCNSCALADIPEECSERFVFWHEQVDDDAFIPALEEDEEEDVDTWKQYTTILQPLHLNWDGNAREIIETLRTFGFTVEFDGPDIDHVDPNRKIRVLPGRMPTQEEA